MPPGFEIITEKEARLHNFAAGLGAITETKAEGHLW
jgi:hypothetical protein